MFRTHETSVVWFRTHACTENGAKDTACLVIQFRSGVLSFTQALEIWVSHMIVPVAVAGCSTKTVGPCSHLYIKSISDGFVADTAAAPIADNDSVETPLSLENVTKKPLVMAVELTVVKII